MSNKELLKQTVQAEEQGRKLFPNKGANIALSILGGAITLALVGAIVYVYVL